MPYDDCVYFCLSAFYPCTSPSLYLTKRTASNWNRSGNLFCWRVTEAENDHSSFETPTTLAGAVQVRDRLQCKLEHAEGHWRRLAFLAVEGPHQAILKDRGLVRLWPIDRGPIKQIPWLWGSFIDMARFFCARNLIELLMWPLWWFFNSKGNVK
jgi:hypothetical protein